MISAVLSIIITASVHIWTEPSLVSIDTPAHRSPYGARNAHLYAARGEYESFQLCITSGEKSLPKIQIEGAPLKTIPAPDIYRIGILRPSESSVRAQNSSTTVPDVLLDPTPEDLPPHSTQIFWICYHIPSSTNPGVYKGKLRLLSDGHYLKKVRVKLEVFDFTLPELPSLPMLIPLQPNPLESFYGLRKPDLTDWKPVYDSLAGYRLSLDITPIQSLIDTKTGAAWNDDALKCHLDYLTPALSMACIALGGDKSVLSSRTASDTLDPFSLHLRDMAQWLNERGWLKRACLPLAIPADRTQWASAAQDFIRIGNAEDRIARLTTGPPYPQFERQADRWAFSFADFSSDMATRMKSGVSLRDELSPHPTTVTASSCGPILNTPASVSIPEDACDGTLTTAWTSQQTPTGNHPEWLQFDFSESVTAATLLIQWVNGMDSAYIEALTSIDGINFSSYTVRWEFKHSARPYAPSQSLGEFRFPNTFKSLRLVFKSTVTKGPIGIAEITLNPKPETKPAALTAPIQPWLLINDSTFPSLCPGVHPVEPRAVPWLCWLHQFDGIVYPWMNDWPAAWKKCLDTPPSLWDAEKHPGHFLTYPGRNTLLPSIRLERLRDGLEDYEYLKAFSAAVQSGKIKKKKLLPLAQRYFFAPQPNASQLDAFTDTIIKNRLRILRALSQYLH